MIGLISCRITNKEARNKQRLQGCNFWNDAAPKDVVVTDLAENRRLRRDNRRAGGWAEKDVVAEDKSLLVDLRDVFKADHGIDVENAKISTVESQVVNGTNYHIAFTIGIMMYEATIFKPLPGSDAKAELKKCKLVGGIVGGESAWESVEAGDSHKDILSKIAHADLNSDASILRVWTRWSDVGENLRFLVVSDKKLLLVEGVQLRGDETVPAKRVLLLSNSCEGIEAEEMLKVEKFQCVTPSAVHRDLLKEMESSLAEKEISDLEKVDINRACVQSSESKLVWQLVVTVSKDRTDKNRVLGYTLPWLPFQSKVNKTYFQISATTNLVDGQTTLAEATEIQKSEINKDFQTTQTEKTEIQKSEDNKTIS